MTNGPKRGVTKYTHSEYGECWFNNTRSDGMIIVCDSPNFKVTDNYYPVSPETLTQPLKQRTAIQSKPKTLTKVEKQFKAELNVFFASQTLIMPFICDECQQPLYAFTDQEKRCCIAHIVPKSNKQTVGFPTVAIHPQNRLFLCAKAGCHHKYDNATAVERSKMHCYPLAIERFNNFKDLIPEDKIEKAYTYLNIK